MSVFIGARGSAVRPSVLIVNDFGGKFHAADRLLGGVIKNVQADKAGEQMPQDVVFHLELRYGSAASVE